MSPEFKIVAKVIIQVIRLIVLIGSLLYLFLGEKPVADEKITSITVGNLIVIAYIVSMFFKKDRLK